VLDNAVDNGVNNRSNEKRSMISGVLDPQRPTPQRFELNNSEVTSIMWLSWKNINTCI
jgi:hypothetical protein